jgi:hypothetical protein
MSIFAGSSNQFPGAEAPVSRIIYLLGHTFTPLLMFWSTLFAPVRPSKTSDDHNHSRPKVLLAAKAYANDCLNGAWNTTGAEYPGEGWQVGGPIADEGLAIEGGHLS